MVNTKNIKTIKHLRLVEGGILIEKSNTTQNHSSMENSIANDIDTNLCPIHDSSNEEDNDDDNDDGVVDATSQSTNNNDTPALIHYVSDFPPLDSQMIQKDTEMQDVMQLHFEQYTRRPTRFVRPVPSGKSEALDISMLGMIADGQCGYMVVNNGAHNIPFFLVHTGPKHTGMACVVCNSTLGCKQIAKDYLVFSTLRRATSFVWQFLTQPCNNGQNVSNNNTKTAFTFYQYESVWMTMPTRQRLTVELNNPLLLSPSQWPRVYLAYAYGDDGGPAQHESGDIIFLSKKVGLAYCATKPRLQCVCLSPSALVSRGLDHLRHHAQPFVLGRLKHANQHMAPHESTTTTTNNNMHTPMLNSLRDAFDFYIQDTPPMNQPPHSISGSTQRSILGKRERTNDNQDEGDQSP